MTTLKPNKKNLTVFLGAARFDVKHLVGNAYLAESIFEKSEGRFLCYLPQDAAAHGRNSRAARDRDIRALLAADLALFSFEGPEVDSGTVAEFMLAKAADIPAVVLRTDLRSGGDQLAPRRDPWNAMLSFYPRTVVVRVQTLTDYRTLQRKRLRTVPDDVIRLAGQHASATAAILSDRLAERVVNALDRVRRQPPQMPRHLRQEVYEWLALMPGLRGKAKALRKEFEDVLSRKVKRDLL